MQINGGHDCEKKKKKKGNKILAFTYREYKL